MGTHLQTQTKTEPSASSSPALNLQRKCAGCGQHSTVAEECEECSGKRLGGFQPKLTVSRPGDPYEEEADRIAEQVMRMPASHQTASRSASPMSLSIQRKPSQERAEDVDEPSVRNVISSPGQPLDPQTRAFFEPRFGHDFSHVRVHTDRQAATSAEKVSARAYTVGEHVVFGARQYAPDSTEGRRLLAHELTHVIQQGGADSSVIPEDDEETADYTVRVDTTLPSGEGIDISRKAAPKLSSGPMLQRADCPCCADAIAINNITRIDTATRMGHSFDVDISLSYPASGPQGSCTLEWWEKTNVPAIPGHPPNTWTDMFALLPTSPTFNPWNNRSERCATSSPVTINDPPALGRRPGRTVTRTLEFRIVVNSMPPSSDSGCAAASQQVTAKQVLTMVNGAPDWAASSFTTP